MEALLPPRTRISRRDAALALCATLGLGCSDGGSSQPAPTPAPTPAPRTYAMGFSWFPPRPDLALALQVADLAAMHSDAALILTSVPWDALLDGQSADAVVRGNVLGLAAHYRGLGLPIVVSIDPSNGLDRASDAPALVARARSLAEPAIQQLYRAYVVAVDALLQPNILSIASETNLVRSVARAPLYAGLVQGARDAVADLRAAGSRTDLIVTVQVEAAWGRAQPGGTFIGVDRDRTDFPFIGAFGLSSFPHLAGFTDPDQLPLDHYTRLVVAAPLPLLVIEGGWPSDAASGIVSSPQMQQRYLLRQAQLLDAARAVAWFQINFTDLDETQYPGTRLFARLGLVDTALAPKPALGDWDAIRSRMRT